MSANYKQHMHAFKISSEYLHNYVHVYLQMWMSVLLTMEDASMSAGMLTVAIIACVERGLRWIQMEEPA